MDGINAALRGILDVVQTAVALVKYPVVHLFYFGAGGDARTHSWQSKPVQILRLLVVTLFAGWFCWFLGTTVIDGLKTGAIRHTDSTKRCRKDQNPFGFWSLVVLFTAFVMAAAVTWFLVVSDVIRSVADTP